MFSVNMRTEELPAPPAPSSVRHNQIKSSRCDFSFLRQNLMKCLIARSCANVLVCLETNMLMLDNNGRQPTDLPRITDCSALFCYVYIAVMRRKDDDEFLHWCCHSACSLLSCPISWALVAMCACLLQHFDPSLLQQRRWRLNCSNSTPPFKHSRFLPPPPQPPGSYCAPTRARLARKYWEHLK